MDNSYMLKCPVCGQRLFKELKNYKCQANHTFDIAKQGFVNLLLANQKSSKEPGDSKEMMRSRREFLGKEYYSPLAENINEIVFKHCKDSSIPYNVLDAGCGEGYYLSKLQQYMQDRDKDGYICYYGFDISKEGVKSAASHNKNVVWAVGSIFNMPILSSSMDCLLHIFAPVCQEEFIRVLKDNGILISVTPGKEHLYGLKQVLYDNPYYNDEETPQFNAMGIEKQTEIKYGICLENTNDIKNLLKMTPYYWRTSVDKIKLINDLDTLRTCVHFIITVYKQNKF